MSQKKILVIDDEDGVRELVADVLRGEGYDVTAYAEGLKMAEYLEHNIPDVVWLDLMLKDVEGPALLAILTKNFPQVKVICMTAYTSEDVISSVEHLGAFRFVSKPFENLEEIIKLTEEALCQPGSSPNQSGNGPKS